MRKISLESKVIATLAKPSSGPSILSTQVTIYRMDQEYFVLEEGESAPENASALTADIASLLIAFEKQTNPNSLSTPTPKQMFADQDTNESSPLLRPATQLMVTKRQPKEEFTEQWKEFFGMMPKFTGSGFTWEIMAEIAIKCGFSLTSVGFSAAAGVGDCIGVGTGNALTHFIKLGCGDKREKQKYKDGIATYAFGVILESYGLYGVPSLAAGAIWQSMVNVLIANGPVVTALGTGGACALAFFITLCAMRAILSRIPGASIEPHNQQQFIDDLVVSLWNVFGAAGAFTATSFDTPFQTEKDAMCLNATKAGLTTLIGYTATRFPETLIRHITAACPYREEVVKPMTMTR